MLPSFTSLGLICALVVGGGLRQTDSAPLQTAPQPAAEAPAKSPDASEIHFSGEVLRGQIYDHDIGHDLIFRLTPATSDEGGGWVIEILPLTEKPDDPVEFSTIATPPYHAYNERYVAGAFGYSAKEAIDSAVRKFQFVQSLADEHIASEVVDAMLYPSIVPEAEKARIAAESAGIFLGTGEFRIVHSRIAQTKGQPDTIAWIKFDVTLNFASDVTLQQILAPHPSVPHHR